MRRRAQQRRRLFAYCNRLRLLVLEPSVVPKGVRLSRDEEIDRQLEDGAGGKLDRSGGDQRSRWARDARRSQDEEDELEGISERPAAQDNEAEAAQTLSPLVDQRLRDRQLARQRYSALEQRTVASRPVAKKPSPVQNHA